MNKHREIIYKRRKKVLEKITEAEAGDQKSDESSNDVLTTERSTLTSTNWPLHTEIIESLRQEAAAIVALHTTDFDYANWNLNEISESLSAMHEAFGQIVSKDHLAKMTDRDEMTSKLQQILVEFYEAKCASEADPATVARAESMITLRAIDTHWMDHIDDMAHLREQVAFSGFAQRDPLVEYQDQGFRRFQQLIATIQNTIVRTTIQLDFGQFVRAVRAQEVAPENLQTNAAQIEGELESTGVSLKAIRREDAASNEGTDPASLFRAEGPSTAIERTVDKIGRNDPCPCGSGKKYKKCHGQED